MFTRALHVRAHSHTYIHVRRTHARTWNNIWSFSFIAQEIEADQFDSLTEDDLTILIPNIGPRRKFQNNVKKYLQLQLDEVFS